MLTTVWPAFRMLSNTDHGLDWAVWRDALTFEHVVYVRKNVDDDETLAWTVERCWRLVFPQE